MPRDPNTPARTPVAHSPAPHPVWSLTLPAWASAPGPERRGSTAPALAAALARLRRLRRGAQPTATPELGDPAGRR
jgi:hypothetical protein